MEILLNYEERQFVHALLAWDRKRRSINLVLLNVLLVFGGIIVIVIAFSTVQSLNDRTIFWVTLPGFLVGLLLVGVCVGGLRWSRERHLFASIITKLQANGLGRLKPV